MGGFRARWSQGHGRLDARLGVRLGDMLAPAMREVGTRLRVLAVGLQTGVTGGSHRLRLGLAAGAGWAWKRLEVFGSSVRDGLAALKAGASIPAPSRLRRSDPLPAVPAEGGTWLAHVGPDGTWRVRDATGLAGDGTWQRLDRQAFGDLRLLIAEAGGVMVTVQTRNEGGRLIETRHRTRGHVLDGDRRDQPAVVRRCDSWVEYFYYAAGAPTGHERLSLVCLIGMGWPTAASSSGMVKAA